MAWSDPNVIKIDSQAIADMKNKIKKTSDDISEQTKTIVDAVTNMEKEWQTPEGKKFLSEIDLDWTKQAEKYVRVLTTISSMLEEAEHIYDELIEKAEALKF